jgi:ribosomal protein S27AE
MPGWALQTGSVAESARMKLVPRKTCPRCGLEARARRARCRRCGYRYPEQASPKPAGLAMGAGFPLFVTGVLILFAGAGDLSPALIAVSTAMVVAGVVLFFDPR